MTEPLYAPPSPTASRFHRLGGPLGGVASGLARTFGLSATVVRLGLVGATIVFGAVVVAIYVALWYVLPVDRSVPFDQRPERPPLLLLILLALFFGLGAIFDFALGIMSLFFSLVPVTVLALGAVVAFLLWRGASKSS